MLIELPVSRTRYISKIVEKRTEEPKKLVYAGTEQSYHKGITSNNEKKSTKTLAPVYINGATMPAIYMRINFLNAMRC